MIKKRFLVVILISILIIWLLLLINQFRHQFNLDQSKKEVLAFATIRPGPRDLQPLSNKKLVALTFDDGPNAKFTPILLDDLRSRDIRATFFLQGRNIAKNSEIVATMASDGHEIENHGFSHRQLTLLDAKTINEEIASTNDLISQITGESTSLLRPSYGSINQKVKHYSQAPLILWSVDTRDWQSRNSNKILKILERDVRDGSVILMHDSYSTSVEAALAFIDKYKLIYEFVTISELAQLRNRQLVAGETYYHFYPESSPEAVIMRL